MPSARSARPLAVTIVGGGICGSLASLLLAREGHAVTVIERDPEPPPPSPERAWTDWERRSVRQFRLGHLFLPRFRAELEAELPEVVEALREMGALDHNVLDDIPVELVGDRRDGDERFRLLTARRPVMEATIAQVVANTSGIDLRRGEAVTELIVEQGRPGRVVGVVGASGRSYTGDLVIDAAGRNSPLPRLLVEAGLPAPVEEQEDSGFTYYAQTFRSTSGQLPADMGGGLQHYDSVSTLTLPADHQTWACAFVTMAGDKPTRALREPEVFDRVWRHYPLVAHWIDAEPFGDLQTMTGIEDRIRHAFMGDIPAYTGLVSLGDAWACTNPSMGRGASLALIHAIALRDHLNEAGNSAEPLGVESTVAWRKRCEATVQPWYDDTVGIDRHRLAQMQAQIAGHGYQSPDPAMALFDDLLNTWFSHPDLLRAYLDLFFVYQTRDELFSDQALVNLLRDQMTALGTPAGSPGPSRSELLDLLNA